MPMDQVAAGASGLPAPLGPDGLRDAWHLISQRIGLVLPEALREDLIAAWQQPHRQYHDLRHLGECVALCERWSGLANHPAEVALGLWFHDAICDPAAHDNEPASAAWAMQALADCGVTTPALDRIQALIMATRHGDQNARADDERLIVDIDLAILGSDARRFEQSSRDVRLEHASVPESAYRQGRARILRRFLDREWIYMTAQGRAAFEDRARKNLTEALRTLDT